MASKFSENKQTLCEEICSIFYELGISCCDFESDIDSGIDMVVESIVDILPESELIQLRDKLITRKLELVKIENETVIDWECRHEFTFNYAEYANTYRIGDKFQTISKSPLIIVCHKTGYRFDTEDKTCIIYKYLKRIKK